MRKRIVTVALVSGLGLSGAALLSPSLAVAETDAAATGISDRVSRIKEALQGLVTDKTLTQAQADKVATTLAEKLPPRGPRGFGRGGLRLLTPEATASVLGITAEELRTQREAGKTLAQIAAAEGMSKATLIDKLVAAAKAQLAADVKAGRLTQAQADQISSGLEARITEKVDRVGPPRGHHHHDAPAPSGSSQAPSADPASA